MAIQSNTNLVRSVERCAASLPPADGCGIIVYQECYYHVARLDKEDGRLHLCLVAFSFSQIPPNKRSHSYRSLFPFSWLNNDRIIAGACGLTSHGSFNHRCTKASITVRLFRRLKLSGRQILWNRSQLPSKQTACVGYSFEHVCLHGALKMEVSLQSIESGSSTMASSPIPVPPNQ